MRLVPGVPAPPVTAPGSSRPGYRGWMQRVGWRREHLRHVVTMFWQGRNPAASVYDAVGPDFFLALAPGWLNLGLWDGGGSDPAEAPVAVRRLVERLPPPPPRR